MIMHQFERQTVGSDESGPSQNPCVVFAWYLRSLTFGFSALLACFFFVRWWRRLQAILSGDSFKVLTLLCGALLWQHSLMASAACTTADNVVPPLFSLRRTRTAQFKQTDWQKYHFHKAQSACCSGFIYARCTTSDPNVCGVIELWVLDAVNDNLANRVLQLNSRCWLTCFCSCVSLRPWPPELESEWALLSL